MKTGEILWHSADIVGDQKPSVVSGYRQYTFIIETCETGLVSGSEINGWLTTFQSGDNRTTQIVIRLKPDLQVQTSWRSRVPVSSFLYKSGWAARA